MSGHYGFSETFKSPSRRAVLGGLGATFGALALRGYSVKADAPIHFTHGVASGDPLVDRVILWTRALPGDGKHRDVNLTWQVAHDENFTSIVSSGTDITNAARDYTFKVDADSLQPGESYFYRFISEGATSPTGQTKTLPKAGIDHLRLGVVSCSNYPQGYFNVYREISKRKLDAVIHLGDYIYEYGEGTYDNKEAVAKGRKVKPSHEITRLEDYRMRYGLYRSDEDLQAVHSAHPFICVWDDHEISNDTWKEGAENHNEGEGDFFARKAAAIQAYYEWLPIREPANGRRDLINRTFEFGDLASLIMMDTRLVGRDKQLDYQKDLPLRKIPFDFTDPQNPKALLNATAVQNTPKAALKFIQVPFDLTKGKPVPVTDWPTIQSLDPKNLPKGLAYLPDGPTFLKDILGKADRTILGTEQERWLTSELKKSSEKNVPWQILGQQLLIGKVGIPHLADEDIDFNRSSFLTPERIGAFRLLGSMGLPLNLDAWDGYPTARERLFEAIKTHANNAISIAGDTHNAWAFDLKDSAGNHVAVEYGTPGVSSPGMETYLPADPAVVEKALYARSPELKYVNAKDRGWMELNITREKTATSWHYVSTVLEKTYDVMDGPVIETQANSHTLSAT